MSKRTSDGERRITLQLAAQQADIDVVRIRIERLRKDTARLVSDLDELLAGTPFVAGKGALI